MGNQELSCWKFGLFCLYIILVSFEKNKETFPKCVSETIIFASLLKPIPQFLPLCFS